MKKFKNLARVYLSIFMLLILSATVYGAAVKNDKNAFELLMQANKAFEEFETYKYTGNILMDMVMTVGEESESQLQDMSLEGVIVNSNGNNYTLTTTKTDDKSFITEALMQDGKYYTRTYNDGNEKPKWIMTDFETQVNNEVLSMLNELANNEDTEGLIYTFGEEKEVEGVAYDQVIITFDTSAMEGLSSLSMGFAKQFLAGTNDTDELSDDEQVYINALLEEIYKNMNIEMEISCYIEKESKILHSMTIDGVIEMNLMFMEIEMELICDIEIYGVNESIEIPVIKASDIAE